MIDINKIKKKVMDKIVKELVKSIPMSPGPFVFDAKRKLNDQDARYDDQDVIMK